MMRNLFKLFIVICLVGTSQGCNDILSDTNPSTSIPQEVALTNPGAVRALRARIYGRFHDIDLSTLWLLGPAAIADNTDIRPTAGRYSDLNNNVFQAGLGTAAYANLYDVINDANLLINAVEEGVLPEDELAQYQGEAYMLRAFAFHQLVRIFGYEPGMAPSSGPGAGFNLGVIIKTEPTLSVDDAVELERSTVEEVYAQIMSDIQNSISLLSQGDAGTPFYVTEAAAQALLARVQLYQRNWVEADAAATATINLSGARLANAGEVETMFDETVGENPEAIFVIDTDPTTESAGVNDAISAYTSVEWMAQIPTQDLIDLYEPGDVRLAAWFPPCIDEIEGPNESPGGCVSVNDQGLELHKYAQEQGQYADDYVHFRVSEMLLIQAEARLHTAGPAQAVALLDELRAHRGVAAYSGALTEEAVMNEILDERRRELIAEGHRFFDLKRLGRPIRKVEPDGTVSFIPYNSFKLLDNLPADQLEINEKLVQNPGYE